MNRFPQQKCPAFENREDRGSLSVAVSARKGQASLMLSQWAFGGNNIRAESARFLYNRRMATSIRGRNATG
jgi:hypothetical protein